MKARNVFCINLLIFSCLIFCTALFSQKVSPASHWTIGLDMGINVNESFNNYYIQGSTNTFLNGGTSVHYRVLRWLGLTANLGYIQHHVYHNAVLWNGNQQEGLVAQKNLDFNIFSFSIGPQVLVRIWQGDLGLRLGYGRMYSLPRVSAITSEGDVFEIKYKGEFERYFSYDLTYTYWPKPRFGVKVGFEILGDNDPSEGYYQEKTNFSRSYPEANPLLLTELAPRVDGPELMNITLGVVFRFQ